jgi:putative spermidine/putrescine transport system ATP-binding protein
MSDRLAVFNRGRIEQIGPPAEIYEHPSTAFVADFVGVSNVCSGELARRLTGSTQAFAIRPEKIVVIGVTEQGPEDWLCVTGRIRAVTYHGATTRYAVTLDDGGELVVMQQNAGDSGRFASIGAPIRLAWPRHLNQLLVENA